MFGQRKRPGYFGVDPIASPILGMAQNPGSVMAAPLAPAKPKVNLGGVLADALSGFAGQPGQSAPLRASVAGPGYEKPRGWKLAAGIFADAMSGLAGQPGQFAPMMERRRQEQTAFERGEEQYRRRRSDELADRMAEANKPQFFSGNEDRIAYDPTTGTTRTLYDAPTDAETYANTLGYEPATPQYGQAIQDYVLRSNGPTAFESRFGLEAQRNDGRQALQTERLGVTQRGQDLANSRGIRGQDIASRDRQRGQDMRPKPKPKAIGGAGDGAIARNPKTGERMKLIGGKWVPIK